MVNLLAVVVHAANIHNAKSGIFCGPESQLKRCVGIYTRIKINWEIFPKQWVVGELSLGLTISVGFQKIMNFSTASTQSICMIRLFAL